MAKKSKFNIFIKQKSRLSSQMAYLKQINILKYETIENVIYVIFI